MARTASETDYEARLAAFAARTETSALGAEVLDAARDALVNVVGCAIAGSSEPATTIAAEVLLENDDAGHPVRSMATGAPGRPDDVALVDGVSAHVLDFDDTHLSTILHPGAPVGAAALAVAQETTTSGVDLLGAFSLGMETAIRVAVALGTEHYERGWHITGTAGIIGAAAATSRILGLDEDQMLAALGLASTQALGHREQFGTMAKSLHVGLAARNGVQSARLARAGFDASRHSLSARRGMLWVLSDDPDPGVLVDGLGTRWEVLGNRVKAYACGVVSHPLIDAMRRLRSEARNDPIERVAALVHPLVTELMGRRAPQTGLEARFSATHCAAVAYLFDHADPVAFADAAVADPEVIALRDSVDLRPSTSVTHMTARVVATTRSGATFEIEVSDGRGSDTNPLTSAEVDEKFLRIVGASLGDAPARTLLDRVRTILHDERGPAGSALAAARCPDGLHVARPPVAIR